MSDFLTITFVEDDGTEVELTVLEQTTVAGNSYLLVTDADADDEELEAYILKETKSDEETSVYEEVSDDEELDSIGAIFAQLLDQDGFDTEF